MSTFAERVLDELHDEAWTLRRDPLRGMVELRHAAGLWTEMDDLIDQDFNAPDALVTACAGALSSAARSGLVGCCDVEITQRAMIGAPTTFAAWTLPR